MPQLVTVHQRSTVARLLALAIGLYEVELADTVDLYVAWLETYTLGMIMGPTWPGQAKRERQRAGHLFGPLLI